MINIVIADDHAIIRRGLDLFLKFDDEVKLVGEAVDGDELPALLDAVNPDILLLDIDMPKMNGITVLRSLADDFPDLKIIILSMHPENLYGPTVRKIGALGYINKEADPREVIKAIKSVYQGELHFDESIHKIIIEEKIRARKIKLSTRESEVLQLLSIGKSNKDISEELGISDKTVSTYKQRLLNKLQARNLVDLINYAKNYLFS